MEGDYRLLPLCAICRKPKANPRRIFLALDDLVEQQATQVVDCLNKINVDTPADSVKKASRKIREQAIGTKGDPAAVVGTFQTIYSTPITNLFMTAHRTPSSALRRTLRIELRHCLSVGPKSKRKMKSYNPASHISKRQINHIRERRDKRRKWPRRRKRKHIV